jgi:hypothetical protein
VRAVDTARTTARILCSSGVALMLSLLWAAPVHALPTMIRLGYTNCAACHISPQGGGPLNEYGRGIDQAQSLRGGEYAPMEREWLKLLNLNVGSAVTQDLRAVFADQDTYVSHEPDANVFRPRLMYRNATSLSHAFRISGIVTADGELTPRPSLAYDPPTKASTYFVNSALVSYRPVEGFEIDAGRDQLPTGINLPDLSYYIHSRNRLGYYDAPTQVKMFLWGKHWAITPYAYQRAGNEKSGEAEHGAGSLVEVDVSGHQRAMIGVTALRGIEGNGERRLVGGYARLGFGRWGILAEHDRTERRREPLEPVEDTSLSTSLLPSQISDAAAEAAAGTDFKFNQDATFAQLFVAIKEWLVASGIAERLQVQQPYTTRMVAGRFELSARLASQLSITGSTKVEKNQLTGKLSKTFMLQLAVKTVP